MNTAPVLTKSRNCQLHKAAYGRRRYPPAPNADGVAFRPLTQPTALDGAPRAIGGSGTAAGCASRSGFYGQASHRCAAAVFRSKEQMNSVFRRAPHLAGSNVPFVVLRSSCSSGRFAVVAVTDLFKRPPATGRLGVLAAHPKSRSHIRCR
jgi:hypothetical protein